MNSDCLFSVNTQIVGKDAGQLRYGNSGFRNVRDTLTPAQILDVCAAHGFATAAILKRDGNRSGDNVAGLRVAQLDFDNTWSIEEATAHPFFREFGIGLYSTPSHGRVQEPLSEGKTSIIPEAQARVIQSRIGQPMIRFRLVFVLDELAPAEQVPDIYAGLFAAFPMADTSCRDAARLFFGSPDAAIRIDTPIWRRIGREEVEALVAAGRASKRDQGLRSPGRTVSHTKRDNGTRKTKDENVQWFDQNKFVVLADHEVTTCEELRGRMRPGYENRLSCFSPFRQEQRPSVFVKKDEAGRLYFYDTAIRKTYAYAQGTWHSQKGE